MAISTLTSGSPFFGVGSHLPLEKAPADTPTGMLRPGAWGVEAASAQAEPKQEVEQVLKQMLKQMLKQAVEWLSGWVVWDRQNVSHETLVRRGDRATWVQTAPGIDTDKIRPAEDRTYGLAALKQQIDAYDNVHWGWGPAPQAEKNASGSAATTDAISPASVFPEAYDRVYPTHVNLDPKAIKDLGSGMILHKDLGTGLVTLLGVV